MFLSDFLQNQWQVSATNKVYQQIKHIANMLEQGESKQFIFWQEKYISYASQTDFILYRFVPGSSSFMVPK